MHINYFLIPFVILLGLLLSVNDNKNNRKIYIIICSIVFVFLAAMRNPEWMTFRYGIDTWSYKELFDSIDDMKWSKLLESFGNRYFEGGGDQDFGYNILMKVIGSLTHSFYVFSLLSDLVFFIPLGIILYRYSEKMSQLIFAFVFYISLIQVFLFGGARQIFAMGFDMMAFLALADGKKWRSLIYFLLGITLHFSSILFLLPLLTIWRNLNPKKLKLIHVLCFILFPVVLIFPNQIIYFLGVLSGVERYANYALDGMANDAGTFVFLIESLSLFILVAIKTNDLLNSRSIRIMYVMVPFFTIFAPLIQSNGSMIRISLYFHLFLMLLVPQAIDCMFKNKDRNYAYFIAIFLLSLMTLTSGSTEYYFFWQNYI